MKPNEIDNLKKKIYLSVADFKQGAEHFDLFDRVRDKIIAEECATYIPQSQVEYMQRARELNGLWNQSVCE